MEPKVCMIILNWNGFEVTVDCLNSILGIDYSNYKIVLVDNGSIDGSVTKLNGLYNNGVIDILPLNENHGFTGGNNIGIEYAKNKYNPDYFLLINNDTTVEKPFLKEMVQAAESSVNCYAVVPKIFYFGNKNIIWNAGGKTNRLTGIVDEYGKNQPDGEQYNSKKEVSFMSGCCALIKSEAIKNIGVLDDRFFAYSEDTDYSIRILNSKHTIVYAPKAVIYHKVSFSSESNNGKWFTFYLATRNIILLQKKHLSKAKMLLFVPVFAIRWVLYLTVKLLFLRDFKSIKSLYLGVKDGVQNKIRFVNKKSVGAKKVKMDKPVIDTAFSNN